MGYVRGTLLCVGPGPFRPQFIGKDTPLRVLGASAFTHPLMDGLFDAPDFFLIHVPLNPPNPWELSPAQRTPTSNFPEMYFFPSVGATTILLALPAEIVWLVLRFLLDCIVMNPWTLVF